MTTSVRSPFLAVTAAIGDDAQVAEPSEPLPPGVMLQNAYRIGRLLARGGTAVVYEATQVELVRRVAIKLMTPESAGNAGCAHRFEREARFVASMQHPHIVAVHELGRANDGSVFIAMELVDGPALRDYIEQQKTVPWRLAVELAAQIADALVAVHASGIVHGDVSAANVLLSQRSGKWCSKLVDFGAARRIGESVTQLATHATRPYAAPELHAGHAPTVRSDLYALGVLLKQMLGDLQLTKSPPLLQALLAAAVDPLPIGRPASAREFSWRLRELLEQDSRVAVGWSTRAAAAVAFIALGVGAFGFQLLRATDSPSTPLMVAMAAEDPTPFVMRTAPLTAVARIAPPQPARRLSPEARLAHAQLIAALDRWISDHNSRVARDRAPVMAIRVGKPTIAFDSTGNAASLTYRKRFSYAGPGYSKHSTIEEHLNWAKIDGSWQLLKRRQRS